MERDCVSVMAVTVQVCRKSGECVGVRSEIRGAFGGSLVGALLEKREKWRTLSQWLCRAEKDSGFISC